MTDRGTEGLYKGVRDRGRKGRDEGNTGTSDVGQKEVIANIWVRPDQSSSSQSLKKRKKKKRPWGKNADVWCPGSLTRDVFPLPPSLTHCYTFPLALS